MSEAVKENIVLRIIKWLDKNLERTIALFFAISMFVLLFLQVVCRYIFRYPLPWSEEWAVICFVLSTYFGGVVAIRRRQLVKIEFFTYRLSPKGKLIARIVSSIMLIVFCFIMSFGVLNITQVLFRIGTVTSVTRFPKFLLYGCIPVCLWLCCIRYTQEIWVSIKEIKQLNKGEE